MSTYPGWPEEEEQETTQAADVPEPDDDEFRKTVMAVPDEPDARELESPYSDSFIAPTDPGDPTQRAIPIRAYLSNPTPEEIRSTENAIEIICNSIGFEIHIHFDPELASWFKRLIARSKDAITHDEVLKRLAKIERAVEVQQLEKPQAEADKARLEGAAKMLEAMGNNNAAIQVGSVLIVKKHNPDGPGQIAVRTLTQTELAFLEQNQHYLQQPTEILRALEDLGKDADSVSARPRLPE